MSIFDIPQDETPQVDKLAEGFLLEANKSFEQMLEDSYSSSDRFWYRNRDEEGNPALEGNEPSGLEVLTAMGPEAESFMGVAYARVSMLVSIATSLGQPEIVDLERLLPPVEVAYNEDGSVI